MARQLLLLAALIAGPAAFAADSRPLQKRYCAGMQLEQPVKFGGRVDCLSREFAIEVEWVKDWYQAVGQSLYYAKVTNRKPGIVLLCPESDVLGEGKCRSYLYRLEAALSSVAVPVAVWECFPEDATLADCLIPEFE